MTKPPLTEAERKALENIYTNSLGNFIRMFSYVEQMLKQLLQKTAGVDQPVALALFSGTRAEAASQFIRRCYEARGLPIPDVLGKILAQISIINNFRNDVMHQDWDFRAEIPIITNRRNTINLNALRETPIHEKMVDNAIIDLGFIMLGLGVFTWPEGEESQARLDTVRRQAWRHKSPEPPNKGRVRQKSKPRRAPKRPPQS